MMMETAREVAKLDVQGIKIHLLHLLKGTPMVKQYEKGHLEFLEKDEYINLVADQLEILPPEMIVHRITGDGPIELMIGPMWSVTKWEVLNGIDKELERRGSWQGKHYVGAVEDDMKLLRVLPFARHLLGETIIPGETVVDATAGNGNDTQFLAEHVGENGHVFAFDIQQAALDSTAARLGELNERVTLILDSHDNVEQYVDGQIGGAVFNLGYLPHSEDLSIVTKPDSTIKAIHQCSAC